MADLTTLQREAIWKALDGLAREHRAFPDAQWVMPTDDIVAVEELAKQFEPENVLRRLRYLFDEQMPRLADAARRDPEGYEEALANQRSQAVRAILIAQGVEGLQELRDSAKEPFSLGWAMADSGIDVPEMDVLRDLEHHNVQRVHYAFGYCRARYRREGLSWVDATIPRLAGRALAQARLLRMVSEFPAVWEHATRLGPAVEESYWKEFVPVGLGREFALAGQAAVKLIEYGRPAAAADLLALYPGGAHPEQIASAIEAVLAAPAEEQKRLSPYDLQRLLEALRTANFAEDRLAILEWRAFPGLGFGVAAPTLERMLARDPALFVQMIALCFKRADGAGEERPSPEAAQNAFHILLEWRIIPGSTERKGNVDGGRLDGWLARVLELLTDGDRVAIGSQYIGHSFAHAKEDDDNTWPTRPVRDAIERLSSQEVERGFRDQIFNNRGVTTRGLGDGGAQERALSDRFDAWELKIRDRWPRTAAVLRSVAESYRVQAQVEDEEAERFRRGLNPF